MNVWLRRLGMAAVYIAAFAGPFFLTLKVMDYFATPAAPPGKQIFSLIMSSSGNNWSLGPSKTRITDIKPSGITMVLQNGEPSFGFRTNNVTTRRGQGYAVRYDIAVSGGAVNLGIVEANNSVRREALSRRSGVIRFVAQSDNFMLALYNPGSTAVTATVAGLSVIEEQ